MQKLETPAIATSDGGANVVDAEDGSNGGPTSSGEPSILFDGNDSSACSTPYVSAPSSPGRGPPISGYFYSAPASPMHFVLSTSGTNSLSSYPAEAASGPTSSSFEFEFSGRLTTKDSETSSGSMTSADELFLNGQIRPMTLSNHLQRPQALPPLVGIDEIDDDDSFDEEKLSRGRDMKLRDRSMRRRTRSLSPLRNMGLQWLEDDDDDGGERVSKRANENTESVVRLQNESSTEATVQPESASSSRSSSVGRSSRRWVFLKEFLYRSKSEGRNNGHKFWVSFAPGKDKKMGNQTVQSDPNSNSRGKPAEDTIKVKQQQQHQQRRESRNKAVNGVEKKRRVPLSPHELHYTANRAQAEEMKKKTYLPYRQGLLGCLGFSSNSYGAMNGFARALNPVSSR